MTKNTSNVFIMTITEELTIVFLFHIQRVLVHFLLVTCFTFIQFTCYFFVIKVGLCRPPWIHPALEDQSSAGRRVVSRRQNQLQKLFKFVHVSQIYLNVISNIFMYSRRTVNVRHAYNAFCTRLISVFH